VFDACSLIDIADASQGVLTLIGLHVGPIWIPTPVLSEVDSLDETQGRALGLMVVEPTLEQLDEAAEPDPALSFADRICLVMARDAGAICVTGDEALGQRCDLHGVAMWRGLRPILALVECGVFPRESAVAVVRLISANNCYITDVIVAEFDRIAMEVEGRTR
jgi:rRNA-processing protein FCF1